MVDVSREKDEMVALLHYLTVKIWNGRKRVHTVPHRHDSDTALCMANPKPYCMPYASWQSFM